VTDIRLHVTHRLNIPTPDWVMFGAALDSGRVRIWASQNLDGASLISNMKKEGIQDLFDPSLFMPRPADSVTLTVVMNDCVMVEDSTYADALARLLRVFTPDEPLRQEIEQ